LFHFFWIITYPLLFAGLIIWVRFQVLFRGYYQKFPSSPTRSLLGMRASIFKRNAEKLFIWFISQILQQHFVPLTQSCLGLLCHHSL
jgi:hypothetical protein